ncbi:PAAR domain-containing protein [Ralstonia nicotianae]
MTRPFILLGDKTDHGGVVITASGNTTTGGKGIACVGDKVTCPQSGHGGTTVIVTGDPNVVIDGRQAARHGDKTTCGATLLASQGTTGSI